VELVGLEPTTSSLRKMASPNLSRAQSRIRSRSRSKTVQFNKIQGLPGELPQQFFRLASHGCGRWIFSMRPHRGTHIHRRVRKQGLVPEIDGL